MDDETQQNILEKLMEYGDSLLEENSQTPHSASKRRIIKHHHSNTTDDAVRKKKMKKKKKKKTVSVNASNEKYGKGKKNSLKDFEEELKLFQASQKEKSLEKEEITVLDKRKADDGQKTKKRRAPEVIVFDDPTKRKKKTHSDKPESRPGSTGVEFTEGEVDLDQARHEVWKFGISGLSFDDKEKQEAAKAIQLGAKPPKREFVNYKELMETNRQKKIEERQQREIDRQMGLKISKKKEGKIQLQNKGFWTDKTQRKGVYVDGQLGKYKRGVQVFSKRELAKIKNKRGKGKR